jgi:hypothetical protein
MRATGVLAEMAERKKKPPISSYAMALPRAGRGDARILVFSTLT